MYRAFFRIAVIFLSTLLVMGCATVATRDAVLRSAHPEWDESTVRHVAERVVTPGMTPEMVKAALGKPTDVTPGRPGQEAWTYELGVWDYDHPAWIPVYVVYFQDGKVSGTEGDRTRVPTWLRRP